jgi:ketosteroid isomerase-like protein
VPRTRATPESEKIRVIRRGLAAMGRGEPQVFAALCAPAFEMHLVGIVGEPVHYRGPEGVHDFFRDMGESWSSFGFEIDEIRDLGDLVLVLGRQQGRGRASGVEVESPRGLVITFEHGAVSRVRYFMDPREALDAVRDATS